MTEAEVEPHYQCHRNNSFILRSRSHLLRLEYYDHNCDYGLKESDMVDHDYAYGKVTNIMLRVMMMVD